MRKFERFIIYPMLFIAIFFSFAADDVQQTTAQQYEKHIVAKKITVLDDDENKIVQIQGGSKGKFGGIVLYNSSGTNVMGLLKSNLGKPGIVLFNEKGKPLLSMSDDSQNSSQSFSAITGYANGEKIYNLSTKINTESNDFVGSLETYDNTNGSKTSIIGSSIFLVDENENVKDEMVILD